MNSWAVRALDRVGVGAGVGAGLATRERGRVSSVLSDTSAAVTQSHRKAWGASSISRWMSHPVANLPVVTATNDDRRFPPDSLPLWQFGRAAGVAVIARAAQEFPDFDDTIVALCR